LFFERLKEL